MTRDTIFQATDLVQRRTEFLEAAREGSARLRDKDGTSLVMVRESRLQLLEKLVEWGGAHLRLDELLKSADAPSVSALGGLAWLRVFDREDLEQFAGDLQEALVASSADNGVEALENCVRDWRLTAQQLADPLRRAVLVGPGGLRDDGVEVKRPQ